MNLYINIITLAADLKLMMLRNLNTLQQEVRLPSASLG